MVAIASRLGAMRSVEPGDWHAGLDAALVSLSGRVRLHDSAGRGPEAIVRELYESVFGPEPSTSPPAEATDGTDPGEG